MTIIVILCMYIATSRKRNIEEWIGERIMMLFGDETTDEPSGAGLDFSKCVVPLVYCCFIQHDRMQASLLKLIDTTI